jgi:hypothetical protein
MEDVPFKHLAFKAKIFWSEPVSYDAFLNRACSIECENIDINDFTDDDGDFWVNDYSVAKPNFYMILGRWGSKIKLFYIGKNTNSVFVRLKQPDHMLRKNEMKSDYPRYKLLLSLGHLCMELGSKRTSKRIDEIESILIYAHEPKYNKSKIFKRPAISDYWIKNYGYTIPLHNQLYYGLKVED